MALNQFVTDIICTGIDAASVCAAALIGVGGLKKIAKKSLDTYFCNYADKKHDLEELLRKATSSITVVAAYGDRLLEEYASDMEACLARGIKIRYLMLTVDMAEELNETVLKVKKEGTKADVYKVHVKLQDMKRKGDLEVREWDKMLTASYIGIDLDTYRHAQDALIQVMLYQYKTEAKYSPITYLSYKNSRDQFSTTANAIEKMWSDAKPLCEKPAYRSV